MLKWFEWFEVLEFNLNHFDLLKLGKPLCVITALAPRGSLRALLDDHKQSLTWQQGLFCSLIYFMKRCNTKRNKKMKIVLQLLVGIGAGVHHLHMEKILHRDLAARNVLLTAALEPLITDFGLSGLFFKRIDFEFFTKKINHGLFFF